MQNQNQGQRNQVDPVLWRDALAQVNAREIYFSRRHGQGAETYVTQHSQEIKAEIERAAKKDFEDYQRMHPGAKPGEKANRLRAMVGDAVETVVPKYLRTGLGVSDPWMERFAKSYFNELEWIDVGIEENGQAEFTTGTLLKPGAKPVGELYDEEYSAYITQAVAGVYQNLFQQRQAVQAQAAAAAPRRGRGRRERSAADTYRAELREDLGVGTQNGRASYKSDEQVFRYLLKLINSDVDGVEVTRADGVAHETADFLNTVAKAKIEPITGRKGKHYLLKLYDDERKLVGVGYKVGNEVKFRKYSTPVERDEEFLHIRYDGSSGVKVKTKQLEARGARRDKDFVVLEEGGIFKAPLIIPLTDKGYRMAEKVYDRNKRNKKAFKWGYGVGSGTGLGLLGATVAAGVTGGTLAFLIPLYAAVGSAAGAVARGESLINDRENRTLIRVAQSLGTTFNPRQQSEEDGGNEAPAPQAPIVQPPTQEPPTPPAPPARRPRTLIDRNGETENQPGETDPREAAMEALRSVDGLVNETAPKALVRRIRREVRRPIAEDVEAAAAQ
ncbi:MAG TPA: hypothetical protein VI933_03200 [archaeon]|nr:hypothetical protein [archaeon]